MYFKDIANRL